MKTFVATVIGVLFACNFMVTCNAASITDLKTLIEGVYILDEWNIDGHTFRPPAVEGRYVLVNGNLIGVLINTTQEAKKTYTSYIGSYSITPTSFGYRYETMASFTQITDNVTLSRTLPLEGKMREYTVTQEGNSVHLQFEDKYSFDFNPDGLTYSEGGKPLRVWHRAKSE
jgi:hypothetical protein